MRQTGWAAARSSGATDPRWDQLRVAAVSAASTMTAWRPASISVSTSRTGAGRPEKKLPIASRAAEYQRSIVRKASEVPTKSCQRCSASWRSRLPSEVASMMWRRAES